MDEQRTRTRLFNKVEIAAVNEVFRIQKPKKLTDIIYARVIVELIHRANYIFGCTGTDITADIDICNLVNSDKSLISCSSEDIEIYVSVKVRSRKHRC